MSEKSKIIVIDANIIIRAVLGIRTFSLIADHSSDVQFLTPDICYDEVAFHLPNIAKKRHISSEQEQKALNTLNQLKTLVIEIEENIYNPLKF